MSEARGAVSVPYGTCSRNGCRPLPSWPWTHWDNDLLLAGKNVSLLGRGGCSLAQIMPPWCGSVQPTGLLQNAGARAAHRPPFAVVRRDRRFRRSAAIAIAQQNYTRRIITTLCFGRRKSSREEHLRGLFSCCEVYLVVARFGARSIALRIGEDDRSTVQELGHVCAYHIADQDGCCGNQGANNNNNGWNSPLRPLPALQ